MNMLTRYFDLASTLGGDSVRNVEPTGQPQVLPQYAALTLGIVAEPLITSYIAKRSFSIDWSSAWQSVLFAVLMGIIIFPAVYKDAFDPKRPFIIQLCAIFTSGIGWQSLFQAATGANPAGVS
jgi:hypothetical protein